jgi:hypothetical protein
MGQYFVSIPQDFLCGNIADYKLRVNTSSVFSLTDM